MNFFFLFFSFHRDIKPENILLDSQDEIKLGDFGSATKFEPHEKLKNFPGSPLYIAPEVQQHKPYDGPKADVWSLGVVLYVLITAKLPEFAKDGTYK